MKESIMSIMSCMSTLPSRGNKRSQNTQQRNRLFFEEWQHSIIEQIGSDQSVLPIIEFGECHPSVSIDEGLLINASHNFESAHIIGILRA